MNKILRQVFKFINNIYPKKRNTILFHSKPDFWGNPRALFEWMVKNEKSFDCTWLVESGELAKKLQRSGINAVERKTFIGILKYLSSQVITTNHDLASLKSKRQTFINLWHGIPLKKIGYMDEDTESFKHTDLNHKSVLTVATSTLVCSLMAACFHIKIKRLQITGLPRNDLLFENLDDVFLSKILGVGINHYSKIILYMPTYRERPLYKADGGKIDRENIFRFKTFKYEQFSNFLREREILFVYRLHPHEEPLYTDLIRNTKEPFVYLSTETLRKHNIDLYTVIGKSDMLITDYSSVFFDYLLLDRPIVFTPTDQIDYKRIRGFLLEPYNFWAPGPKVITQEELQKQITVCLDNPDYYKFERETIRNIIHKYQDNQSCKRVADILLNKSALTNVGKLR